MERCWYDACIDEVAYFNLVLWLSHLRTSNVRFKHFVWLVIVNDVFSWFYFVVFKHDRFSSSLKTKAHLCAFGCYSTQWQRKSNNFPVRGREPTTNY